MSGKGNQSGNRLAAKTLPQKEYAQFKSILRFYEFKQYKKGLKAAETILKKYPEHGETLALKGLILNSLNKKTEAYDYVKRGLKNDLTSHVCWHVLGLLHRSDQNYAEAIKCYRNALRHDKENSQILRDLSLLQIHQRDLKGFLETRRNLLMSKPNQSSNWIQFSIAYHMLNDCAMAVKVLDSYDTTQKQEQQTDMDYEKSELMIYKGLLLEESGDFEAALKHFKACEEAKKVLDKVTLREQKAQLLLKLNKLDGAQEEYSQLLKINPDNLKYHTGYQAAHSILDTTDEEAFEKVYNDLAQKYPKTLAVKRIPLDIYTGDRFKTALDAFLKAHLRKGTPSLFVTLKTLYKNSSKVAIIEQLITGYYDSLKSNRSFPGGANESEVPTTFLWTLYFIAQHYDQCKNFAKAFSHIDEAITHTPTVIDLYLCKAKIYKHAGDKKEAALLYDTGRKLDLADRYLNTKSALYFLRADMLEEAEKTIGLFAKDTENTISNVYEMQCMWYELESADAWFRTDKLGKALKNYYAVEKHFKDILEDQLDFHTYYLRKGTLRTYIDLLRFEDNLHERKNYVRACQGVIRTFLKFHDDPTLDSQKEDSLANMDPAERKKLERNKKKAEFKAKQSEKGPEKEKEKAKEEDPKKKTSTTDADPESLTLLKVDDKLAVATKYFKLIENHSKSNLNTQLLAFELFARKNKLLLMLQSIKRALQIDKDHPEVHLNVVRLYTQVKKSTGLHPEVSKILNQALEEIMHSSSIDDFNKKFYSQPHTQTSQKRRLAALKGELLIHPEKKDELLAWLTVPDSHLNPQESEEVYNFVKREYGETKAEEFKQKFHAALPHTRAFKPPSTSSEINNSTEDTNGDVNP